MPTLESPSQWRWSLRWVAFMGSLTGLILLATPPTPSPTFEHLISWRVWPEVAGALLFIFGAVQLWAVLSNRLGVLQVTSWLKFTWYTLLTVVLMWQWFHWLSHGAAANPPALYPVAIYTQLAGIEVLQAVGARHLRKRGSRLP